MTKISSAPIIKSNHHTKGKNMLPNQAFYKKSFPESIYNVTQPIIKQLVVVEDLKSEFNGKEPSSNDILPVIEKLKTGGIPLKASIVNVISG